MRAPVLAVLLVPLMTGGCISTAASLVTAPFKAVGQVADWTTTSQDEADRNYGRKMRKKEAREGRARRDYERRCRRDRTACTGYDGYQAAVDD